MERPDRRILITGAHGFIGRNLSVRLGELPEFQVVEFTRDDAATKLPTLLVDVDIVVHLAGENRPADDSAFAQVNVGLTQALCQAISQETRRSGRKLPVIFASSAQAEQENAYGCSKLAAERIVEKFSGETGTPVTIFRFPGVFGKWCRPNYNSVVATYCHNIPRGLPIRIDEPEAKLRLVYIDDVVSAIMDALRVPQLGIRRAVVTPEFELTLADLAAQIKAFEVGRHNLMVERVGIGLTRALYSTYISSLPPKRFAYAIPQHDDPRGRFVEMLKTYDSGQLSFFSARPGVTRGGHYHHTKTEKFLVIRGRARFRFRHLLTDERVELNTSGENSEVVETIPGWSHDITNIGDEEMIVMLWANEVFNRDKSDTISDKV